MLKNMRVLYRILLAFLVVFLLFLISTIQNIAVVANLSTSLEDFYNHPFTVSNTAKDIVITLNQIHTHLTKCFEESDTQIIIDHQISINNLEKTILDDIRVIDQQFLGDKEKVTNLKNLIFNSIDMHNNIINAILNNDYETAFAIMDSQGHKNEIRIDTATEELLLVAGYYATQFIDDANIIQKGQQNQAFYIGVFSFLIILILAFLLERNISNPLIKLVKVMESGGTLDELNTLDIVRQDEIGQVNRSYQEMMKKLNYRENQLRLSNRELESFSYSVSHDLRAPLRHITGYISLLIRKYGKELPHEATRYLDIVKGASEKMDTLINSLLQYSRIGRKELQRELVKYDQIVDRVIKEYQSEETHRKIEWLVNDLGYGYADPSLVTTVWENLIGNAYKYTKNEETAVIEIGKLTKDGEEVFYVKDNGVGFDMTYYDKIFSVFQRLHAEKDFKGVGIGLANVQRIINMHGGKVWAEAKLHEGATLYFTLGGKQDE